MTRWRHCGILAASTLWLTACDLVTGADATRPPQARPAAPQPVPQATSEQSAALRQYLRQVQSSQLSQGLLRQDGGGADAPFSATMLARNFDRIVHFSEYSTPQNAAGVAGALRRWEGPVRMRAEFGPSVPPSQVTRDRRDVDSFARRLTRVSGHPVTTNIAPPNFLVFFVSEDDRVETLSRIATRLPGITTTNLAPVLNLRDDVYCAVAAYATGSKPDVYTKAIAVIRAENPDLLRLSCIHEELAQGLGLANDSPDARPSIFNDDDEFALLTRHDELLLKMLYDPRLQPGMTLAQAGPISRIIAHELLQGPL